MIVPVLAHAGHWATSLAYFAPVMVLSLGLFVITLRERRRGADAEREPDPR